MFVSLSRMSSQNQQTISPFPGQATLVEPISVYPNPAPNEPAQKHATQRKRETRRKMNKHPNSPDPISTLNPKKCPCFISLLFLCRFWVLCFFVVYKHLRFRLPSKGLVIRIIPFIPEPLCVGADKSNTSHRQGDSETVAPAMLACLLALAIDDSQTCRWLINSVNASSSAPLGIRRCRRDASRPATIMMSAPGRSLPKELRPNMFSKASLPIRPSIHTRHTSFSLSIRC